MKFFQKNGSLFFDYLRKSGFPEIINWENDLKISEYIKNSVIERVILRDISFIFKLAMILLERIVKLILSTPGSIININSLSRDWGASKITISNYLKFLEISLLVRSLSNFRPAFLSASRKLKKFYPTTPSLIFPIPKKFLKKPWGRVRNLRGKYPKRQLLF